MNMRHPLTVGGMTVAFEDVILLCGLLHPDVVHDLDISSQPRLTPPASKQSAALLTLFFTDIRRREWYGKAMKAQHR